MLHRPWQVRCGNSRAAYQRSHALLQRHYAETRSFINTKHDIAGLDSRKDLVKNADGSVDLYFGPEAPKGKEKNWIPTVPGHGWFAYFRLYAPTEAYFDRSWKLPDVVRVQ